MIGGYSSNGSDDDFTLVRYDTNGDLDPTFGAGGIATVDVGNSNNRAISLTAQTDGKFLLGGYSNNGTDNDFALLRFNNDGSLDSSFNISNALDENPSYIENDTAVVLDSDVVVFDAELSALDDFNGTTLTLGRSVTISSDDLFSAIGNLAFQRRSTGTFSK